MNKNLNKSYKCPQCSSDMEYGVLKIHGTPLGWLFFGFSYQNLYFTQFDKKLQEFDYDEKKVISESEEIHAYKCNKCDTITFKPGDVIEGGVGVRDII